jgi:hypothetical protein
MPHPFFTLSLKKLPAQLSLFQQQRLSEAETHLLFCSLLLNTEHCIFSSPLFLTEELSKCENAQMQRLANLAFSGCFQKSSIELPAFHITKKQLDISEISSVWEEELDSYRVSALIEKQKHEIRAMLTRVQRAFSNPMLKSREKIILSWLNKVCTLPTFNTIHPVSQKTIPINTYWEELMTAAVRGESMLSYPEADIVEFKSHLEENLPYNYAQEFSLLEELQSAISRKQNYFGYSFADANEVSYSLDAVKPTLRREDYPNVLAYLNAIKANRR